MKAIIIIISLFAISVTCQVAAPVWPNQWQEDFTETLSYSVIGSGTTTGSYYYDWTNQKYRVDRANGKWDRYCGSVEVFTDTPCSHIVVDGNRYLWFPQKNYCCFCCNAAEGCGVLSPNWLSAATWVGTNTTNGYSVDVWDDKGLQDNFYSAVAGTLIPVEINQVPNDNQIFNPETYLPYIKDPSVFDLPSSQCTTSNTCPLLSTCTAVRLA